jgi:hypothetical protein
MPYKNIKFEFPFELERGKETVEYIAKCEVSPFRSGRLSGPPESCYPDEGAEVESVQVYYPAKKKCPENKNFWSQYTYATEKYGCSNGPTCPTCRGKAYIIVEERREELDEMLTSDEIIEAIPDPYDQED